MKALNTIRFAMLALGFVVTYTGCTETVKEEESAVANTYFGKPYRTFVTIQRYNLEQLGELNDTISNVRLEIALPNGQKLGLPESNQYWPIGTGQSQEINRTVEIPFAVVKNDGFKMIIQMVRKGGVFMPCVFDVTQLSQFNRSYVCHTDVQWQVSHNHKSEATADKEAVQIRIFTDVNSNSNEIPKDLARSN